MLQGRYVAVHDRAYGLAAWCFLGSSPSPEDWLAHLRDVREVASWPATPRPCVILEMVDGAFVPNASQRRDLAELISHAPSPAAVALVSSNSAMRGVLQALRWLVRGPGQASPPVTQFATCEDAYAFLEAQRGQPLPELPELVAQARVALGVPSPLAADG